MEHDEFHSLLCRKPFQPFRVIVDDGRTYEVRHRFMTLLNGPYVRIGIPAPGPKPVADHAEFVWLSQIVRVEPLPEPGEKGPSAFPSGANPMDHDEFQRLLRQKPFQPFRVIVDDGRTYDVRYPYMNLVNGPYVKIGIPGPPRVPRPLCDHTEFVWLSQIVRIEPLPIAEPSAPS